MPSTAYHTTVDIANLGFDIQYSTEAEVTIATTDADTLVEVAHADDVWSLTFDEHGNPADGPTRSPSDWLVPLLRKVAPQLQVT